MLVAVSDGNNLDKINNQNIDIIELRLDLILNKNLDNIKNILNNIKKPIILTNKLNNNLDYLYEILDLGNTDIKFIENIKYIDFDYKIDNNLINKFHKKYPKIKIIRSYHNFDNTPDNLEDIFNELKNPDISVYKIITTANNALDNFKVLDFLEKNKTKYNLITHCMGELGMPSRIMGGIMGNCFTYTYISDLDCHIARAHRNDKTFAPGILDINSLIDIYNFKNLNYKTKIYALLGNPVNHSIGHIFHNKNFQKNKLNNLYIKINLDKNDLNYFFKNYAKKYFSGFSVTMPLKQEVIKYINYFDDDSKEINSVNTLKIINNKIYAVNTDKTAVIDLLKKQGTLVAQQSTLILGLSATAQAIIFELKKNNIKNIDIISRKIKNNKLEKNYDIIINTVPNKYIDDKYFEKIKKYLNKNIIYCELDYSNKSSLVREYLKNIGAKVIGPEEIFYAQAVGQFEYWKSPLALRAVPL